MTDDATIIEQLTRIEAIVARLAAGSVQRWPEWLSVSAAANYSSLSVPSVRRLVATGKLRGHRPCRGKVLISRRDLDATISQATNAIRRGRGIRQRSSCDD